LAAIASPPLGESSQWLVSWCHPRRLNSLTTISPAVPSASFNSSPRFFCAIILSATDYRASVRRRLNSAPALLARR
jgi:hypothetical protein